MKRQLTAVFLGLAMLLTATGCTAANAMEKRMAAQPDTVVDAPKDLSPSTEDVAPEPTPAATPAETGSAPVETKPDSAEIPKTLTKEQAQQIALDYLGFTADQVTRMHTEYEIDDGIPEYDVQFFRGDWEYEFEIHAETGKILSFDKDHKYD